MTKGSKLQFDIIRPHPIEGFIVTGLGIALVTYTYWLPAMMEPYFGRSKFVFWATLAGFVLIGAGLWRAGWRHRMRIDAEQRKITSTHGFFRIGKQQLTDFSEIRSVRLRHVVEESLSGGGYETKLIERYPVTLEGPVVSVNAGWSGYYEESFARAKRIAQVLEVPLRDLTSQVRHQ